MRKSHLWEEREIQEVGYKYRDNPLYQSLRPIALKISQMTEVSLSAEEFFYHTLFSLDDLKGNQTFNCDMLGDELYDYLSQRCNAEKKEIENMASSVVLSVAYVLSIIDHLKYYSEITALVHSLNGTKLIELSQQLSVLENEDKNHDLKQWLSDYMCEDSYLSEEIEELVNQIRKEKEHRRERPVTLNVRTLNNNGDIITDNGIKNVNNYRE